MVRGRKTKWSEVREIIESPDRRVIDPVRGCWLFQGGKEGGYGVILVEGKRYRLNRLSLFVYKGVPLDDARHALHSCDIPACFNPAHLRPGTPKNNSDDTFERHRAKRAFGRGQGGKEPGKTIPWETVETIRLRYKAGGVTQDKLAAEFGLHQTTVSDIVNDRVRVLPEGVHEPIRATKRKKRRPATRLTQEIANSIHERLKGGESQSAIARDIGCGMSTINRIALGKTWPERH